MKKILLILSILTLMGCSGKSIAKQEADLAEAKKEAELEATKYQRHAQSYLDNAFVVNRDGCQYFFYGKRFLKGGMGMLTHKGNCNNQIHK